MDAVGQQIGDRQIKGAQQFVLFVLGGLRHAADKATLSGDGGNPSFRLQLTVGALDGIGVDGKLYRKLPDAGQLFAGRQNSGFNLFPVAVHNLRVNGSGIPIVKVYHIIPPACTNCTSTVMITVHTVFVKGIKRAVAGSNRSIDQIVRVQRVTNRLGTIQMSW